MIAVIMCGGKAIRMKANLEKPLLKVNGIPMVDLVVSALQRSGKFVRIIAAVSPNAPKTRDFLRSKGLEIIDTAGVGYPQDLTRLLFRLKPERVMVVPSDIPLLNAEAVKDIVSVTGQGPESAISIVFDIDFVKNIGVTPSVVVSGYCHSGITVFETSRIEGESLKEQYLVMNRKEIALNANTKEELELAEKLLIQRA